MPDPSSRPPWATSTALAVALAAVFLLAPGPQVADRAAVATQRASAALAVPPGRGAPSDVLAEDTTAALEEYWRATYPAAFGGPWDEIDVFTAVRTRDQRATPPPCVNRAGDVAGQAFYCPSADAVAWDADGLIPTLHDTFGPPGVVVVLAHEVGHAVQSRLGVDLAQQRDRQRFPTILLEAMADCYAGATIAEFIQRPVAGVPLELTDRDNALRALVGFRDPLGVAPEDAAAHGNAFDRVSAFQDGFAGGPKTCAQMTADNRAFTQRRFGSEADLARAGNLPLRELLTAVERDVRTSFTELAPGWRPPPLSSGTSCPPAQLAAQGPAAFCPADGRVAVDIQGLDVLHREIGDFAGATLVAARYGMALLAERGIPSDKPSAGAAATCLAGAYTASLLDRSDGFQLSPGDLDEAVQVLLVEDWAARDTTGTAARAEDGFDRVGHFRTGAERGPTACLSE